MKLGVGFFLFSVLWSGIHAHERRTNAKGWKKKSSKTSSETNNELFSCDDTGLVAQYCPRATNVAVISHADNSNRKFWDMWKEGAEGALGGSIGLTFMDVGYDVKKSTEAIEDVCNSRDYDALVVTVPYEKDTHEYILMDEVIDACAVKGKPIFTTNTDTYHNEHVHAFVGTGNYDMGRSCAQAVLHPDDMDVVLGRKEAPLTSFIDRSVTYSFYREDEDKNDSLNRRVQGLVDEFKKKEIDVKEFTGFDTNLDRDGVVFVMSMNHISKFDWPNAFLCGDEDISRPDVRQYGQSPFMQGLTAVLTAAAAADIKYKGRKWSTVKGNPVDGVGATVSTQAVQNPSMTSVCPVSRNKPCVPAESLPRTSTLGASVDLSVDLIGGGTSTKPNVLQNVGEIKKLSLDISNTGVHHYYYKSTQEFSDFISSGSDIEINYFIGSASASVISTTSNSGSNTRETAIARGYKWDNATFFDPSQLHKAPLNKDFINDLEKVCDMYKIDTDMTHFKPLLDAWGTHFISSEYYGGYAIGKISLDYATSQFKKTFDASFSLSAFFLQASLSAEFKKVAEENKSELKVTQEYFSKFNSVSANPDSTETRNDPFKMNNWVQNLIQSENNGVVLVSELSPWSVLPQVKSILNARCGDVFDPNKIYPAHIFNGTSRLRDLGKANALINYALTLVDSKLAILPSSQDLKELKENILQKKEVIDQVNYWDGYFIPYVTTKSEIDALLENIEESVIIYPKVDMWEASVFDYTYNRSGRKVLTRNRRAVKPWRVQRAGMFIYSESNKNLGSKKDNPFGGYTTAGHLLFDLGSIDKMGVGKVLLHLFRIQINDQRPGFHTKKKKVQLRIHNCGGKAFFNYETLYPIRCSPTRSGIKVIELEDTHFVDEWLVVDVTDFFHAAKETGDLHLRINFTFDEFTKQIEFATKAYTREGEEEQLWPKLVFV